MGPRPRRGGLRLHWPQGVDPVDGLTALEQGVADVRLVEAERRRLLDPVVPPAGWSYMLAAGPGDVYRHAVAEGRPAIEVVCDDDAGVIEKDIDVALRSDTTIEWSWRVEALPGVVPEITPWTHDLLGIAAVFDSGSSTAGTPVSSLNHERFMGPPPARIRSLRLVAVSHFDHGCGRATFRDICAALGAAFRCSDGLPYLRGGRPAGRRQWHGRAGRADRRGAATVS